MSVSVIGAVVGPLYTRALRRKRHQDTKSSEQLLRHYSEADGCCSPSPPLQPWRLKRCATARPPPPEALLAQRVLSPFERRFIFWPGRRFIQCCSALHAACSQYLLLLSSLLFCLYRWKKSTRKSSRTVRRSRRTRAASTALSARNQYVVLNFNTFVCTTCSGIHREMQHKIKSVGMSTFSIDEIKAVAAGGNAVAKASWMAKHGPNDPQMQQEGETDKIRSFIKAKYQAKRWWSDTPAPVEAAPPPAQPVSAVVPNAPKLQLGTPTPAVAPAPAPAQPAFGAFDASDPAPAPAPPPALPRRLAAA